MEKEDGGECEEQPGPGKESWSRCWRGRVKDERLVRYVLNNIKDFCIGSDCRNGF
jgi:hypothetical protein